MLISNSRYLIHLLTFLKKSEYPLLKPGQTVYVSVKNVNGAFGSRKSLRLFLYTVSGDTAFANNNLTIILKSLSQHNFQIEIDNKDLHYPGVPTFEMFQLFLNSPF